MDNSEDNFHLEKNKESFDNFYLDPKEDKYEYLFVKAYHPIINLLIKDIEISFKSYFLLMITCISLFFLEFSQFSIYQTIVKEIGQSPALFDYIFVGLALGTGVSILFVDRITKPLNYLRNIICISFSLVVSQLLLKNYSEYMLVLEVLFLATSFINITAIMLSFKLFLMKTTILERGRIWAYLLITIIGGILLLYSSFFFSFFIIYGLLTASIIYLTLLTKKKNLIIDKEKFLKLKEGKSRFLFFYLFIAIYSLTAGFATPIGGATDMIMEFFEEDVITMLLLIISLAIVNALLVGLIFDYFGRIAALSFIILAVAIANFINSIEVYLPIYTDMVVLISYISAFMIIPLFVGDEIKEQFYGRIMGIAYLILFLGLTIGISLRQILGIILEAYSLDSNLITNAIFFACILCYLFLVNMKEPLPRREQKWKDYLIHVYVVHVSGLLLYNYAYHEKKEERDGELVSGGIIGIVSILKEIIKGEKHLETIDHKDRKLMIKTNSDKTLICALLVSEELKILRKKLNILAETITRKYKEQLIHVTNYGLKLGDFKGLKRITRKIFGI